MMIGVLMLGAMSCSHGRDRDVADDLSQDDGPALRIRDSSSPRKVREELLDNRRGPKWLAKLPQKLTKGDNGNRPFAVQDARVSGGLRESPVSTAVVAMKDSVVQPALFADGDTSGMCTLPKNKARKRQVNILNIWLLTYMHMHTHTYT